MLDTAYATVQVSNMKLQHKEILKFCTKEKFKGNI